MLIALFVLIFIILICRIIKLKLLLKLQFNSEKKSAYVSFLFFNFRITSYEFEAVTDGENNISIKQYKKEKLKTVYSLNDIVNKLKRYADQFKESFDLVEHRVYKELGKFLNKKRLAIEDLSLQINSGLQDAAATAILNGIMLTTVNILLCRLYDRIGTPKKASINIKPYFQKILFEASLKCMISVRLSSASAIGAALLLLLLRNRLAKKDIINVPEEKHLGGHKY